MFGSGFCGPPEGAGRTWWRNPSWSLIWSPIDGGFSFYRKSFIQMSQISLSKGKYAVIQTQFQCATWLLCWSNTYTPFACLQIGSLADLTSSWPCSLIHFSSQLHSAATVLMFQAHDLPICLNLFSPGKRIFFFALYGDNLHCWCISFPGPSLEFSSAEGTSVFFRNSKLGGVNA